jgi:hypothetical protein
MNIHENKSLYIRALTCTLIHNKFKSFTKQVIWRRASSNISAEKSNIALILSQRPCMRTVLIIFRQRILENKRILYRRLSFTNILITTPKPCIRMIVISIFFGLFTLVL